MKNKCDNCNKKIRKSYSFCPSCGKPTNKSKKEWGMLGENDSNENQIPKITGGGLMGNMMNKMIGNAMKMLEQEMNKELGEAQKQPKTKIKLMVNGKEITPMEENYEKDENTKILPIEFSQNNLKKWKKMEKKEPNSKLRRIDNKIKYEIEMPEVNSIQDVSIIKMENSLEVRAIGKKTGYLKNISIDLPLKKYSLLKGTLTLELDAE